MLKTGLGTPKMTLGDPKNRRQPVRAGYEPVGNWRAVGAAYLQD